MDSSLLLSGGDRLTLRDILPLRLRAGLVVLSACETGLPDAKLYDEVVSLATGMLQAGAGTVISSLWAVEDLSTVLLMRRFYELLIEKPGEHGVSVTSCLHTAQEWITNLTLEETRRILVDLMTAPGAESNPRKALMGHFVLLDRRGPKPFAHPYYWAGFYVTGNAHVMLSDP